MPGQLVHFEMPAQDAARAKQFYSSLFGWQFRDWEGPVEYHMFEGQPGGAVYPSQEGEQGVMVYFDADDINAEAARVRELGGEAGEPAPIPGIGWYAHCKDPDGNKFGLFQTDESVAPEAQS